MVFTLPPPPPNKAESKRRKKFVPHCKTFVINLVVDYIFEAVKFPF
jgi:hypothetical protein